jgi:hypothetical protein
VMLALSDKRGDTMARQEQDFNKEINRQFTTLFIKDSNNVTIDLTEIQSARVLQFLLTLYNLQGRLKPLELVGEKGLIFLKLLRRLPDAEMQDVEINTLLQGQSIHIENCTDVTITVKQIEVEKVVEIGLTMLRLLAGNRAATSAQGRKKTLVGNRPSLSISSSDQNRIR